MNWIYHSLRNCFSRSRLCNQDFNIQGCPKSTHYNTTWVAKPKSPWQWNSVLLVGYHMDLVTRASRTFGYDQAKYRMFCQTSHISLRDAMRNRYLYLQHMFSKLLLSFCKAAMQLIFSRDALTAAPSCMSVLKGVHLTFARENILLPILQSFIFRG